MITITWYGHAATGLKTGGKNILIDPYFSGNPASSITAAEADADVILLTHAHGDHLGDAVDIARRTGVEVIGNVETARWLASQGVQARGIPFGEYVSFPYGKLKLTPAVHRNSLPDGSESGEPGGFLLVLEEKKIYVAGDTALFEGMKDICRDGLDLAFLPIGGYYTMDPSEALQAVKALKPQYVIPYHFNTWDKIMQDPAAWAAKVEAETTTRVQVLKPGGTFDLL